MTDVCVVGSGAGAAPIIYELAKAGHSVKVLEKGPWIKREQFNKDEIVATRRSVYTPNLKDERHVISEPKEGGDWDQSSTYQTGWDFWNGNVVGGSSNFMSGYFHRLKPNDFKLKSTYGAIEGANIEDWPIEYADLEPYYAKVEDVIGVSGRVVDHKYQEPRSTADFPQPPLQENIVSSWLDEGAENQGYEMVPVPRAILSQPKEGRKPCYYSNYCGSYGCFSGAKSSAREALLNSALEYDCSIIPNAKVFHLESEGHQVKAAWYYDGDGNVQKIHAKKFVIACQAVETSRLLLMSEGDEYPNGLANSSGQVGKNLLFSAGGVGSGYFYFEDYDEDTVKKLNQPGVFVNRSIHRYYEIEDEQFDQKVKGGIVDFLWEHANAVPQAIRRKWEGDRLIYGSELKRKMKAHFTQLRRLRFEVFNDWLPNDNCFVSLDNKVKDQWGNLVANIHTGHHEHDLKVGEYLSQKAGNLMKEIGGKDVYWSVSGSPPANLQAGGCRFGNDPEKSVLDKNCKAHDTENLYVTDGSFMPTGGSATYTWTIYANAFRVADHLKEIL